MWQVALFACAAVAVVVVVVVVVVAVVAEVVVNVKVAALVLVCGIKVAALRCLPLSLQFFIVKRQHAKLLKQATTTSAICCHML